ncbi:MAG: hypothetical protein ACM3UZ_09920 [Acidobacteriota bacterium]
MFLRVAGDSLQIFIKNIGKFFILGLLLFSPLIFLQTTVNLSITGMAPYKMQTSVVQLRENPQDMNARIEISQAQSELRNIQFDPRMALLIRIISAILGALVFVLFMAGSVLLSDRIYQEDDVGYGDVIKGAVSKVPGLIVLAVVIYYGFAISWLGPFLPASLGKSVIDFVTYILPYLLVFIMVAFFALSLPAYMFEDIGPFEALRRGFRISFEHQLPMFVLLLIMVGLILVLVEGIKFVGNWYITNAYVLVCFNTARAAMLPFVQALPVVAICLYYRYILGERQNLANTGTVEEALSEAVAE